MNHVRFLININAADYESDLNAALFPWKRYETVIDYYRPPHPSEALNFALVTDITPRLIADHINDLCSMATLAALISSHRGRD